MAIWIKHVVAVRTSRDKDFKKAMWYPDVDLSEVVIDTFTKQASTNFTVPLSSSEALTNGDVAAVKGIYLESNAACKVYLNGSTNSLSMVPAAGKVAKLFLEAEVTTVEIENESTDTELEGVYICWGDPTP